jgi:hypothetical protein
MAPSSAQPRESQIVDAFVDLADSLVAEYDQLDFLYRLLDHGLPLVGADAGGVLLHYEGRLHLVASSNEDSEDVEVLELQHDQGPARDAFQSGEIVRAELADAVARWPVFAPAALKSGWSSALALPLRLRGLVIGSFVVFWSADASISEVHAKLLQGFADVGTIAVLQQRAVTDVETVNAHLHVALEGRLKIEQAKGMLAEQSGMKVGDAFEVLRRYARSTNQRLKDAAAEVIDGNLDIARLM